MQNMLKKLKFKEKETWLILISFIYLIISIYYLGTLIYWDNYYNNLNIVTDDDRVRYFSSGRIFLIRMLFLWFVCSVIFIIGWIILKLKKNKNDNKNIITTKPEKNNISPQS